MRFRLIDGNTFYASEHQVFEPNLRRKLVIVLSNNDGCVVTRTAEAKALVIKRDVPLFQIKDLVEKHEIVVRSSNYELYQSMSNCMMVTVCTLVPKQEIYSIDEQFALVLVLRSQTTSGKASSKQQVRCCLTTQNLELACCISKPIPT